MTLCTLVSPLSAKLINISANETKQPWTHCRHDTFCAVHQHHNRYATAIAPHQPHTILHKLCLHHHLPCFVATNISTVLTSGQNQPRRQDLAQSASVKAISNCPKPPSISPTYEQRWRTPPGFIAFAAIVCAAKHQTNQISRMVAAVLLRIRIYHNPLKISAITTILHMSYNRYDSLYFQLTSLCIWV